VFFFFLLGVWFDYLQVMRASNNEWI